MTKQNEGDVLIQNEVIARIEAEYRRQHAAEVSDVGACRYPKCAKPALGLDGYCIPHSRERERSGRWHTPRLTTETEEQHE